MMRTVRLPLNYGFNRPAFWGIERDLKDVFDTIDHAWSGTTNYNTGLGDFKETDHAFLMSFEMPGVANKDLDVQIEDNTLLIDAKKRNLFEKEQKNFETITRRVTIPKQVDVDKIQAHCEDGILYLALPKAEQAKPRKIDVSGSKNES